MTVCVVSFKNGEHEEFLVKQVFSSYRAAKNYIKTWYGNKLKDGYYKNLVLAPNYPRFENTDETTTVFSMPYLQCFIINIFKVRD